MSKIFSIVFLAILLIASIAILARREILITFKKLPLVGQKAPTPIADKVGEGIALLKISQPLKYETSNGADTGALIKKQIALAILDTATGEVFEKRIWVSEREINQSAITGVVHAQPDDPSDPLRIDIQWWNSFNSFYIVERKTNLIIVANKYLIERKYLPEQTTLRLDLDAPRSRYTEMVYAPYSEFIHSPDVIALGKQYISDNADAAFTSLRANHVESLAEPGKLVVDTVPHQLVKNIVLVEHVDPGWLSLSDDGGRALVERSLVIIGSNREWAYRYTNSPAGANGLAQFIKPTYDALVQAYPSAKLITDYNLGMADHANAFKAIALLFDYNARDIQSATGTKATAEMLSAAYNGGPNRVIQALTKRKSDWAASDVFPSETSDYIKKYRLIANLHIFE